MIKKGKIVLAFLLAMGTLLVSAPVTLLAEDADTANQELQVIQADPTKFDWNSSDAAYIDFSSMADAEVSSTEGPITSNAGLEVITTVTSGSWRSANIIKGGYMLVGKEARATEAADAHANAYVSGSIKVRLTAALADKQNQAYAVKIDFHAKGGSGVDGGTWDRINYGSTGGTSDSNKTIGNDAVNSDEDVTTYHLLSDANFSENIDGCADFRFHTYTGAQLKVKKITVLPFEPVAAPAATQEKTDDDTVYKNIHTGKFYGLSYHSSTPVVNVIDLEGNNNYCAAIYPNASNEYYLGFKIDDASPVKSASAVTLSITYFDESKNPSTSDFSIQYNAVVPDGTQANSETNYKSAPPVPIYNTKKLLTVNIPLEDVEFRGAQVGGNDFRFRTAYNPGFYIKEISIKVGVEDVTAGEREIEFAAPTDLNDFDSKTVVGYQAWFQASEDPLRGWNHWSAGKAPEGGYGNQTFDIYPDVSDYPDSVLFQTNYANFLNGQPALLYDGTTREAIDTQVKWMQDYGIDGFAVSRFFSGTSAVEIPTTTKLDYMKDAAEKYGRLFYMGYDMSGIGGHRESGIKRLKSDFVLNVEKKFVESPNYAQKDGKPVVSLWGFEYDPAWETSPETSHSRYPTAELALDLITWFQDRGYYVIGGVPDNNWAKDTSVYADVYKAIDMITPWTVGRFNHTNATDYLEPKYAQDKAYIDAFNAGNPERPKSYLPTLFPGFSWANWATGLPNATPRQAGQFMWTQAALAAEYGFTGAFVAMFDEYDEGTSIGKMAEDSMSIPADQYFVTAAADGKFLSSDFYLRETAAIAKMLRGELAVTETVSIPHATGPIFWRNGFERRYVQYKRTSDNQMATTLANVDVCVPDGAVLINEGIDDVMYFDIFEDPYGDGYTTTGENAFNMNGIAAPADGKSQFYFKIADTSIKVGENMVLTYNLRPETDLGSYVFVDLLLDNGQKLSDVQGGAMKAKRGTTGEWTPVTFAISPTLAGRTINAVIIAYDHGTAGEFNAYIDDVVIQYADADPTALAGAVEDALALIDGDLADNYTEASVAALRAAIASAQAVLANESATAAEINNAYLALLNAMNGLVALDSTGPSGSTNPATTEPTAPTTNTPSPNTGFASPLLLLAACAVISAAFVVAARYRKRQTR